MLDALGLPQEVSDSIAKWSNLGVARSTWSSYKTAKIMLEKCSKDLNLNLDPPMTKRKAVAFIDWLARVRGLKCGTIKTYLAGIRQLHIVQGLDPPDLRTGLVQLVLKGIENRDGIDSRAKGWAGRLPMTKNAMLLFKQTIRDSLLHDHDKLLTWAVATIAFAGAFRIHEILSKTEATFDPDFTLLHRDITSSQQDGQTTLHIRLKCPKESRSAAATVVDIYENRSGLCPVKAYTKWVKLKNREKDLPAFRSFNGTPFTGAKLNRTMGVLLGPHTDKSIGYFATHSFRIGLASMLGQAGFEDQDIMTSGRWSSRVFERYIKLARTKRKVMQEKINNL